MTYASVTTTSRTWARLRKDPMVAIALAVLLIIALAAIFAPWLTTYDPYETALRSRLKPPGNGHLLGTDSQGRDMLTRLLYGARTTLLIGCAGTAFGGITARAMGGQARAAACAERVLDADTCFLVDDAAGVDWSSYEPYHAQTGVRKSPWQWRSNLLRSAQREEKLESRCEEFVKLERSAKNLRKRSRPAANVGLGVL